MTDNEKRFIKDIFSGDSSVHDYYHTIRVYELATKIAKQEHTDVKTVQLAALLHDVDDIKLSPDTYATKKNAVDFMTINKIKRKRIEAVCKIIDEVSFAGTDSDVPDTIKGKCVQDADLLDAIGAIGIRFYDTFNDELLKFAVIISQSNGKWVFCKHKERDTYEVSGGHREAGENILETAKRELQEESGAVEFEIKPICVYSVTGKNRVNDTGEETLGLLCFAEITEFAKELHSEMEKVVLMDELPEKGIYPLI